MSGVTAPACRARSTRTLTRSDVAARLGDYLDLTKPRVSVMVLVTVSVGYVLGSFGQGEFARLLHALIGVALVAAGSCALNQWMERATDARMVRTSNRPLPAGRLLPVEVLLFGLACGVSGTAYLALTTNLLTAGLTLLTLVLYAGLYTPLKRKTALCTAVGAVPGALPPVLGYTAAGGTLDLGAFALFAILFLWQFPHFLAIAWLYQDDYSRAGLRMLPAFQPGERITGFLAVGYALVLLPVSLLPSQFALAGNLYFLIAVGLGAMYLRSAFRFLRNECSRTARELLFTSLVYLPVLLIVLTWDHWRLLR